MARQHRQRAGDFRQMGEQQIQDIQREGGQVLGGAQHLWGASGARISHARAELGEEDIDIGTFDADAWKEQRTEELQVAIEKAKEREERSGSNNNRPGQTEVQRLTMELRNINRAAQVAEENWGRRLRDQDLPDLEADITRRVREGDGTLAAIQNTSLANIERDILRTVEHTRRAMSAEYSAARRARRKGKSSGGFLEDLGTILTTAGDMYSTYASWQSLQPDIP